jgi:hypothetical protein
MFRTGNCGDTASSWSLPSLAMIPQAAPQDPQTQSSHHHRTIHLRLPLPVKILAVLVLLLFILPLVLWLAWLLSASRPLHLLVVDKTSLTAQGIERASLYWVLRHDKYKRPDGNNYVTSTDFRGFVPVGDSAFALTGLEGSSPGSIDSLASRINAVYFVDTYGVTSDEWEPQAHGRVQKLYGGLSPQDIQLIFSLRRRGKPVIAEFNFFASPTPTPVRVAAENLLNIRWTGWTGRYYQSLDTLGNPDLPRWIVTAHTRQSGAGWRYHLPGVVLLHENGTVVILEEGAFLSDGLPVIVTPPPNAEQFGVEQTVPYPFWFDITVPTGTNTVVSYFILQTNAFGDSLLARYNLRRAFPAVIRSTTSPAFYYFCLDAADNPTPSDFFAFFKGIESLRVFFYNEQDPGDRRQFYWSYYVPMMTRILHEASEQPPGKASPY